MWTEIRHFFLYCLIWTFFSVTKNTFFKRFFFEFKSYLNYLQYGIIYEWWTGNQNIDLKKIKNWYKNGEILSCCLHCEKNPYNFNFITCILFSMYVLTIHTFIKYQRQKVLCQISCIFRMRQLTVYQFKIWKVNKKKGYTNMKAYNQSYIAP